MAGKKNTAGGGPQAVVSSGKPDVWVTVNDNTTIAHGEGKDRAEYGPGDRFSVHMDQAMSLLQSGHVTIGEVVA